MKVLNLLVPFTVLSFSSGANSIVTIENDAAMTIGSGAYFCADEIIVNSGGSFTSQSPDDVCVTPTGEGDISLPVELTSFTARQEGSAVVLEWVTESEVENLGFIIERRAGSTEQREWEEIDSYIKNPELQGQGSVTHRSEYRFIDCTVIGGSTYDYRLADVSYDGVVTYHVMTSLTVEHFIPLPDEYVLFQNYPNPFNPITTFEYGLPEPAYVILIVYDIIGRPVMKLVNERQEAGYYTTMWDGKNNHGKHVGSGMYLYSIQVHRLQQPPEGGQAGNFVAVKKMVLLR